MIERWKPVQVSSPTQKFVGWILADAHHEKTGQCNPSVQRIAELTGFTARAVIKAIQGLEDGGFIAVRRRLGTGSNYVFLHKNPCTTFTSEPSSPVNVVHGTREPGSLVPVNVVHPIGKERELKGNPLPPGGCEALEIAEPPPSLKPVREVDYSENGNPRLIDRIMAAYPSQAGRPVDARNALCRLAAEGADMADILAKVQAHRAAWERLPQDRRQFIPRIHTYFGQAGYNLPPDAVPSPWVHIEAPKPGLPGSKPQSKKPEHAGYDIRPGVC